jgi:hypothetical protein
VWNRRKTELVSGEERTSVEKRGSSTVKMDMRGSSVEAGGAEERGRAFVFLIFLAEIEEWGTE